MVEPQPPRSFSRRLISAVLGWLQAGVIITALLLPLCMVWKGRVIKSSIQTLLSLRETEEAEKLMEEYPTHPEALRLLLQAQKRTPEEPQVIRLMARFCAQTGLPHCARYFYLQLSAAAGDVERMQTALQNVIALDPEDDAALLSQAAALTASADAEKQRQGITTLLGLLAKNLVSTEADFRQQCFWQLACADFHDDALRGRFALLVDRMPWQSLERRITQILLGMPAQVRDAFRQRTSSKAAATSSSSAAPQSYSFSSSSSPAFWRGRVGVGGGGGYELCASLHALPSSVHSPSADTSSASITALRFTNSRCLSPITGAGCSHPIPEPFQGQSSPPLPHRRIVSIIRTTSPTPLHEPVRPPSKTPRSRDSLPGGHRSAFFQNWPR